MEAVLILLLCVAVSLAEVYVDPRPYTACLAECANTTVPVHCPIVRLCQVGYVYKSCVCGFTVPGDCCPTCVEKEVADELDKYTECKKVCDGVKEFCPMEPADCGRGRALLSCMSGYTVPGDCCGKCVRVDGKCALLSKAPCTPSNIVFNTILHKKNCQRLANLFQH